MLILIAVVHVFSIFSTQVERLLRLYTETKGEKKEVKYSRKQERKRTPRPAATFMNGAFFSRTAH